ncbi:MAG: hypothetical protein ACOX9C_08850 [Kiritimatiellia bacterium]|jgi:hypothetical protein
MKNKTVVSLCIAVAALCVQADYVKLGSVRLASLNDVGSAAAALGILAEEPLLGTMAIGSLQQAIMEAFGTPDQAKPLGVVLYSKTALPDFKNKTAEQFMAAMSDMQENLAVAIYMPVSGSAQGYLKERGATNAVDGAFTADETLYAVVQGDYAVWGDSPATATRAAADMAETLKSVLDGMAVEVHVDSVTLKKYAEAQVGMKQMQKQLQKQIEEQMKEAPDEMEEETGKTAGAADDADTDVCDVNSWAKAFERYEEASMEATAQMLEQIGSLALGLGLDIARGINLGASCDFAPGSDFAKLMTTAKAVDPALYAGVPASADLFYAVGDYGQMAYDSKQSLDLINAILLPQIKDEALRKQVADILARFVSTVQQSGASTLFVDRDSQGRMVFAGKVAYRDPAANQSLENQINADLGSIISKFLPVQTFATFDAPSGAVRIDFISLIKMLDSKFSGEDDKIDAEELDMVAKVFDALMGRSIEISRKLEGDSIVRLCRPVGSDYALPSSGDGATLAASVAALMPAGSAAKPFQVFALSPSSMLSHYASRLASVIGEDAKDVATLFAALPEAPRNGMTSVAWAEGSTMKASLNLSAAELKWFVKMFGKISEQVAEQEKAIEAEFGNDDDEPAGDPVADFLILDAEEQGN